MGHGSLRKSEVQTCWGARGGGGSRFDKVWGALHLSHSLLSERIGQGKGKGKAPMAGGIVAASSPDCDKIVKLVARMPYT